jgi:hypothetical protein
MVTVTKFKPLTPDERRLGRHYEIELPYKSSPTYRLVLYLSGTRNEFGALWRHEQAVLAGELWKKHGIIPNENGDYAELFLWGLINNCGHCVRRIIIRRIWDGVRDLWRDP